jgi:hypothetical protein
MLEMLIKNLLPADFDMADNIQKAQNFMANIQLIANGVQRIEQKLDAEIVSLRDRLTALESVQQTEGERNEHGNHGNGATDQYGHGATGINADR